MVIYLVYVVYNNDQGKQLFPLVPAVFIVNPLFESGLVMAHTLWMEVCIHRSIEAWHFMAAIHNQEEDYLLVTWKYCCNSTWSTKCHLENQ